MNQLSDFLEHKSITPALSDYITELYLKEVLERGRNVHKIEDDRYTKVVSHSKSRFSSSLQPNEIVSLEFHPSGKLLAYSRMDGSLTVWEVPPNGILNSDSSNKIFVNNIVGKEKLVTDLSWNPQEKSQIATVLNTNEIIIWSIVDSKLGESELSRIKTITLESNKTKINKCYYSPRGEWLLATTKSENLYLLSTKDNFSLQYTINLSSHLLNGDSIYSTSWSNTNDYFFIGCKNGHILIFSLKQLDKDNKVKCILTLNSHRGAVTDLRMDPYGRYMVSAGSDGMCIFWDLNTFVPKFVLNDINALILSIDIDHLGKLLVISTSEDKLLFYNMSNGKLVRSLTIRELKSDVWFRFHPNKTWFIKSTRDDVLYNHICQVNDELEFWKDRYEQSLSTLRNKNKNNSSNSNMNNNNGHNNIDTKKIRNLDAKTRGGTDHNKRITERSSAVVTSKIRKNTSSSIRPQKRFGMRYDRIERDRLSVIPSRPSMSGRFNR